MTGKQIVVGYDGSEPSRLALTWAMKAAEARALPILILSAIYEPIGTVAGFVTYVEPPNEAVRSAMERVLVEAKHEAQRIAPTVEVTSRMVSGAPVQVILHALADAELVVLGSRGMGSFSELLVGSTALQVSTHAPCPVVVVRDVTSVEPGSEAGRVVVGVDGSAASLDAVGFAFDAAALIGVGLTALHAWEAPFYEVPAKGAPLPNASVMRDFETQERRVLSEALAGWREKYPDVDVRQVLVHGGAVPSLVTASAGAALLVVGSRGRGEFRSLLLGSVSHAALHHATSVVVVVRPHKT